MKVYFLKVTKPPTEYPETYPGQFFNFSETFGTISPAIYEILEDTHSYDLLFYRIELRGKDDATFDILAYLNSFGEGKKIYVVIQIMSL